jgi:2-polyprenyl-6-methoxyphenol hydroxylase-like FAD-dependent oxidoreductase
MPGLSVAVIGGGIGGTAAALSLLQSGFDVHVYEQARELREVGAGIQVSPNASRVLHRLGLADTLARLGVKPLAFHQRRWQDGRTLLRTPLAQAMEAAFGSPHYQMHRADVLRTLVAALPADRMHIGHRLTSLVDHGDRVEAQFENGARIKAEVLVGADGIHSRVRHILFGPEQPRFTGCMCYRGLVPAKRLVHLDIPVEAQIWMGPGKHFVHYYVRNKELLNFVAIIDQDTWTKESWTDRGNAEDAIAAFEGWHPQLHGILQAVDETFIWALFDRPAMPRWSVGRVTLLGDACHAMLPFMAQGAAQAIEDGVALASSLAKGGAKNVGDALTLYEALRLPRTARVQASSANNKTRFHLPDGSEQAARDAEMAKGATDFSVRGVAWLYGHDAAQIGDV